MSARRAVSYITGSGAEGEGGLDWRQGVDMHRTGSDWVSGAGSHCGTVCLTG